MLIVHPAAAAEARAARQWYAKRDPRVGERFLREFRRALRSIGENPDRWPAYPHAGAFHWFHFRGFPYSAVYERLGAVTHVLAVAADRRRPGYWRTRTADATKAP